MEKESKYITVVVVLVIALMLVIFTPFGRSVWNKSRAEVQKVDDATSYQTTKRVEDECRSMITSYEADKMKYESYKTSDKAEQLSWAEQAKMRANQTAATYNNFVLKNNFVFDGNIPKDIKSELPYLK